MSVVCNYYSKGFKTGSALKEHVKLKRLFCIHCDKGFETTVQAKRHVHGYHNQTDLNIIYVVKSSEIRNC